MAKLPQLLEGLRTLDHDELKAVSRAVDALLAEEPALTDEQWDELEDRLAVLDRLACVTSGELEK